MQTIEEKLASESIARTVAETLDKHYPGHAWAVHADVLQGIVKVHNLKLSGSMGFILMMSDLAADPSMRHTINAGGELLERFGLKRGKLDEPELMARPTTLRGEVEHYA